MRISRTQAKANRDRVLEAAASLFRERGFDGPSVGDLMNAAGFTHGGFYNHFDSKEALAAEALDSAFRQMDLERERAADLDQMMTGYLSEAARRAPGRTCPAAALANDVARQEPEVRRVFADGFERMIASVAGRLPSAETARPEAIALLARLVGALALARAVPDGDLAQEILSASLAACRRDVEAASRHP